MKYPVIAMVALGFLASSCTRKAEGQTVAVVNGQEITVPDLNFALELAKVPEGADKDQARSQALQQLIDRRLLADQARKEGIDKTPEYLNRERRADEDLLISMLAARRLNTAQLPSDREIQTFIASHPEIFEKRELWTLDQVAYPTPRDPSVMKDVVATKTLDQLIAVLAKHNVSYQRQQNRLDTAVIPPDLYGKLNALPAGEPFVVPAGDRSVANSIVARQPKPLTGDQAKPVAVDAMRKTTTANGIQGLLKSLRNSAKIDYQPGYAPKKKS